MKICMFGAASSLIDQKYTDAAFDTCAQLAQAGHSLVYGGGGAGMMGAAARGFQSTGGHVTAIIPKFFLEGGFEVLYDKNDETIYTADIAERIVLMEQKSDAFLVTPGGIGTYEEFFKIIVSISLDRHHKPLIVLNVDGFFDPLIAMLKDGVEKGFIYPDRMDMFRAFDEKSVPEMIKYIENTAELV